MFPVHQPPYPATTIQYPAAAIQVGWTIRLDDTDYRVISLNRWPVEEEVEFELRADGSTGSTNRRFREHDPVDRVVLPGEHL